MAILFFFCICAAIANKLLDYNYMFLVRPDGTPYEIFYSLVGGNPVLYPTVVILLFVVYMFAFYGIYFYIDAKRAKKEALSVDTVNAL